MLPKFLKIITPTKYSTEAKFSKKQIFSISPKKTQYLRWWIQKVHHNTMAVPSSCIL